MHLMGCVTYNYLAIGFFHAFLHCDNRPIHAGYDKMFPTPIG